MSLIPRNRYSQRRGHKLDAAPAVEPVTAAELRTYLRETTSSLPDTDADAFIAEAREYIERVENIAMITQSWRLAFDRWPSRAEPWWDGVREMPVSELHQVSGSGDVRMPQYPLQSVTSVTTYSEDSTATSVALSTFDVDTYRTPGRITLKSGQTWPTATRANNAIEIVYVAGYGDAASDVPAPLKRAVKQMAGYLHAHRGDGCDVGSAYSDSGAQGVVNAFSVVEV